MGISLTQLDLDEAVLDNCEVVEAGSGLPRRIAPLPTLTVEPEQSWRFDSDFSNTGDPGDVVATILGQSTITNGVWIPNCAGQLRTTHQLPPDSAWTIAMRVKMPYIAQMWPTPLTSCAQWAASASPQDGGLYFRFLGNYFAVYGFTGASNTGYAEYLFPGFPGSGHLDSNFHTLVFRYDPATRLDIFVDGVKVTLGYGTIINGSWATGSTDLHINGAPSADYHYPGQDPPFNAGNCPITQMDWLLINDRAMSDAEITGLEGSATWTRTAPAGGETIQFVAVPGHNHDGMAVELFIDDVSQGSGGPIQADLALSIPEGSDFGATVTLFGNDYIGDGNVGGGPYLAIEVPDPVTNPRPVAPVGAGVTRNDPPRPPVASGEQA